MIKLGEHITKIYSEIFADFMEMRLLISESQEIYLKQVSKWYSLGSLNVNAGHMT